MLAQALVQALLQLLPSRLQKLLQLLPSRLQKLLPQSPLSRRPPHPQPLKRQSLLSLLPQLLRQSLPKLLRLFRLQQSLSQWRQRPFTLRLRLLQRLLATLQVTQAMSLPLCANWPAKPA